MKCLKCDSKRLIFEKSSEYDGYECTECFSWFYKEQLEPKTYILTKDQIHEILNIGMEIRQNQLNGSEHRSGNQIIEEWMKENF